MPWLDAAELVDDKWERAFEQAARVRVGFARLLGDVPENIALGQNTHELVTRWLSALPLKTRRRIVTTTGEFHAIRRQLTDLLKKGWRSSRCRRVLWRSCLHESHTKSMIERWRSWCRRCSLKPRRLFPNCIASQRPVRDTACHCSWMRITTST